MKNKNFQESSSLKFFNFEGLTSQKIIEKYETVLTCREKQITDLSIEIGSLNERMSNISDKLVSTVEENEYLKNRIQKRENLLSQELNNKEIMFMRLERKEQECDELNKKFEQLLNAGHRYKENPMKDHSPNNYANEANNSLDSVNKLNYNIYNKSSKENVLENKKEDAIKDNTHNSQSDNAASENKPKTASKSSALDKIRELKEKKTNAPISKFSLTNSLIENATPAEVTRHNPVLEEKSDVSKTEESSYTNI